MSDFEPRMVNFRALAGIVLIGAIVAAVFSLLAGLAGNTLFWAFAAGAFIVTVGLGVYGLLRVLLELEANTHRANDLLIRIGSELDHQASQLRKIKEDE